MPKRDPEAPGLEPQADVRPPAEIPVESARNEVITPPVELKGGQASPPEKPTEERPRSLAERAEAGEKLTPEELAGVTGNTFELRPNIAFGGGEQPKFAYSAPHNTAANDPRYGWNQHKLDSAEPFRLTKTAYLAALEAVMVDAPTVMEARSQFAKCDPCRAPDAPKKES